MRMHDFVKRVQGQKDDDALEGYSLSVTSQDCQWINDMEEDFPEHSRYERFGANCTFMRPVVPLIFSTLYSYFARIPR